MVYTCSRCIGALGTLARKGEAIPARPTGLTLKVEDRTKGNRWKNTNSCFCDSQTPRIFVSADSTSPIGVVPSQPAIRSLYPYLCSPIPSQPEPSTSPNRQKRNRDTLLLTAPPVPFPFHYRITKPIVPPPSHRVVQALIPLRFASELNPPRHPSRRTLPSSTTLPQANSNGNTSFHLRAVSESALRRPSAATHRDAEGNQWFLSLITCLGGFRGHRGGGCVV